MKISRLSGPVIFFICLFVSLGCGGGGGGNGGVSDSTEHHSITECYNCHADGLIEKYADENIFSEWRGSAHGNYAGTNYAGNPGYDDFINSNCNACHDDRGDGELLEDYYSATGISFLGTVNRPLVGCESCHGSGDTHFGAGRMQYPDPEAGICGNCHKEDSYHAEENPEGNGIYEAYRSSPHAGSVSAEVYADGSTADAKAKCSKCHTDEGARLYKDISGGYDALEAAAYSTDPVADVNAVQCRTCHNAHDTTKLLKPAGEGTSAEYETCTACHQNEDDSYHGRNNPEFADTTRIIYDSHFDNATTTDIEGYNIDKSSDRSCSDCHNPHNADTDINKEWAESSHGGHILTTTQDPVTYQYEVTEAEGPAWVHYDFKASNRQACQRCHTATGFSNFVTSPSTYNPVNNDFSYLTGNQKEMLYCRACHTSNTGTLRDPGQFSITSPYSTPVDRITAVPDLNGSNLCMCCHSGRQNGQNIKNYSGSLSVSFSSFNSHYLAAAGIVFRTLGYEYENMDYSDVIGFAHKLIGTTGGTDGNNGPCVGCHMMTDDDHPNHAWEPLARDDDTGEVNNITVYNKVCSRCHDSESTLMETLNTRDTQYKAALDFIETQLATVTAGRPNPIYFDYAANPYFFNDPVLRASANQYKTWPDKNTLGAAFNLNMLKHIPAAYAHNREYTRKLIYDTIDFLDDGNLNDTVLVTVGAGDIYDYLSGTR